MKLQFPITDLDVEADEETKQKVRELFDEHLDVGDMLEKWLRAELWPFKRVHYAESALQRPHQKAP